MTDREVSEAIKKLQFQVRTLGAAIDYEAHPFEALILELDWDQDDFDRAAFVFEQWDHKLREGVAMSAADFEQDFDNTFGVNYQGLKSIVLGMYNSGRWVDVCKAYVESMPGPRVVEYQGIK